MRKKKQPASSSITTAAYMTTAPNPDDSDEDDYTDDGCLSPGVTSHKSAIRSSDDSQLSLDVDDDTMSVDSNDEDQLVIDDDIAEDESDDSCADLVDNWSQDVVVEFDPSTCVVEQTSIGLLMKKCRAFVKLVNKSSILKGYVNKLKQEFKVKRSLQMDCKNRWSSTHYLLQTMTTYRKLTLSRRFGFSRKMSSVYKFSCMSVLDKCLHGYFRCMGSIQSRIWIFPIKFTMLVFSIYSSSVIHGICRLI